MAGQADYLEISDDNLGSDRNEEFENESEESNVEMADWSNHSNDGIKYHFWRLMNFCCQHVVFVTVTVCVVDTFAWTGMYQLL